jgi:hypothetical protein
VRARRTGYEGESGAGDAAEVRVCANCEVRKRALLATCRCLTTIGIGYFSRVWPTKMAHPSYPTHSGLETEGRFETPSANTTCDGEARALPYVTCAT